MSQPSPDEVRALDQLLGANLFDVSARLFVATFGPGAGSRPDRELRTVHEALARMAGLQRIGVFGPKDDRALVVALECVLLWERSLLAARGWSGDHATPTVRLLRRGESVRASADPLSGASAALRNLVLPGTPG
ncbi:conserved hypothetical protein [Microbacterium sp. 8M]|jgi:hypothetical protein|uniref:hypothetical protein n=1 Tax=Microbacterium sp. 8M TaxID=2653153 RepID=UPI0012F1FF5E|nr:hypothetical protein [Microbacterium sp. 8M]VXC25668.1 conserved hypothetical protein [Microbacterium sp. 8M]